MGDDIGQSNLSVFTKGMMGYRTPNIDRIANEGLLLTDYYGEQSCTAGRASFITGQCGLRTGLTKVGLPGAELGLKAEDITIAEALKSLGYRTGQFGKNHLGDRDEHLPTMHGFDEFFGNLYHLNAEEEPYYEDYPKDPKFREKYGPRGVLHCWADGKGGQKIENTGPMPKERMETVDEEFLAAAKNFITRKHAEGGPWFCYFNSTRMHVFTHLKKDSRGVTGLGIYPDGMVEHDGHVGELLDLLDELGVADNTIVAYTTDNGAETCTFPDGGATPFRGEKATNFEGGFRVPCALRWPGVIKPGQRINDICAHEDFIPTFAAAAGEPDLVEKVTKGHQLNGKTFKVHLDGHNLLPFLSGKEKAGPRKGFLYWSDDGDLLAIRVSEWKITFMEQHSQISPETPVSVWQGEFSRVRAPLLYNIKSDPFERGPESFMYGRWMAEHVWVQVPVQAIVAKWLESFKAFPPRAKAASFTVGDVMDKIATASPNRN
jgi:arylsulfatase